MTDRELAPKEVDELVALVNERYRSLNPQLDQIGAILYRWLDGPGERWLATARSRQQPLGVILDCHARLRHLPWELLHDGGFLTASAGTPLCPIRLASSRASQPLPPANRPLRVLFMATSPSNVEPVLDFEHEEAVILGAADSNVELVVEESGSLAGLRSLLARFGVGYFDALHLSGHALMTTAGPRFVFEDDLGGRADASAAELAEAIGSRWPRLVFLSGCHTGQAVDDGDLASMAEALVEAGAPLVLGWALPVGDDAANMLAAQLYGELAAGTDGAQAVTSSRRALFTSQSAYWHLLRLFADKTPIGPLVTPLANPGRSELRHRRATSSLFLDADRKVRVANADSFVGRRRELQRCLRTLRATGPAVEASVLLIHGMGGLGKSTLTARLLDRMRTTHPSAAVWVGALDGVEARRVTEKVTLDATRYLEANKLLSHPDLSLKEQMRFVLDGPMASEACVFVFDDFEKNLDPDGDGYKCSPEALEVLEAFASAIASNSSRSRLVITSRYDFVLPSTIKVERVLLGALRGADLDKKLRLTTNLNPHTMLPPDSVLTADARSRAIEAAAGIPRLIEWLDELISDPATNHEALVHAIQQRTVEFRESVLAEALLEAQAPATRRMLGLAAIYDIPVPRSAIEALTPGESIDTPVSRAAGVGLLEVTPDPGIDEDRYSVPGIVKPLLEDRDDALTNEQRTAAWATGAHTLFKLWANGE